jgi:hypothetical protein
LTSLLVSFSPLPPPQVSAAVTSRVRQTAMPLAPSVASHTLFFQTIRSNADRTFPFPLSHSVTSPFRLLAGPRAPKAPSRSCHWIAIPLSSFRGQQRSASREERGTKQPSSLQQPGIRKVLPFKRRKAWRSSSVRPRGPSAPSSPPREPQTRRTGRVGSASGLKRPRARWLLPRRLT